MSEKPIVHLPEECWELIFNLIGHHRHFEPLSVVCRQFLAISNQLRVSLTVSDQTLLSLPRLLRRFQHLRKIHLTEFHGDLEGLLDQIAKSALDLESLNLSNQRNLPVDGLRKLGSNMKNLRILTCFKIGSLQDIHLFAIATSFPYLEELDISYPEHEHCYSSSGLPDSGRFPVPVTDSGVYALSTKLKNLIKIDLSGNQLITDKSLIALSSNCASLREITVRHCALITQTAIAFVISHSRELRSISASEIQLPSKHGFIESFVYAKALCDINLSKSFVSDELLYSIVEACLPLNKLTLAHCHGFTFAGISFLLTKYQCLSLLNLEGVRFLTDNDIVKLSKFFSMLTSINLSLCSKLTSSTFFTIMKTCHLLSEVKMKRTNIGEEDFTTDIDMVVNPRVKSLSLEKNGKVGDGSIKKFVAVCPNLQVLNLSSCSKVTEESVVEIFKRCSEIRRLEINQCSGIKGLVMDFEISKLEEMSAKGSGVNDDALAVIGKRSCRLLHLDLAGCLNVTAKGVKEVVQNCRVLREINLKWCDNVNVDIVAWMVFSRPSLRKIIPPCGFVPTESQRNLFLRHGCLVYEEQQFKWPGKPPYM